MIRFLSELWEGIRIAFRTLKSNFMRSLLTTLGVVIGITFVVLMGWGLQGLDSVLLDTIAGLGDDILYVDKWDWSGQSDWRKVGRRKKLTLLQVEEFAERIAPDVGAVGIRAKRWHGGSLRYKENKLNNITVMGTASNYLDILGDVVEHGRFLSTIEDRFGTNVAVIGQGTAKKLFPEGMNVSPVGREFRINERPFTVIGVFKKRGTMLSDDVDQEVYIPIRSFFGVYGIKPNVDIAVKAESMELLEETRFQVRGFMRTVRNIQPGEEDDFTINESQNFKDIVETFRLSVWTIGIGMTTLSFIVGIIGIMNIMFVSVTERTREIGIRKSLGAKRRTILFQFLVEAATLCFLGALVAFVLCSAVIFGVTQGYPDITFLSPYIPPQIIAIASVVSIFVGILAGLIPAYRASRLDPIEALRYD